MFAATNCSAPAFGICNAGLFIDAGTLAADLYRLTAMEVLVVVPINKRGNPLAGMLFATEWPVGIVRPV